MAEKKGGTQAMPTKTKLVRRKGKPFAVRWFDPASGTERQHSLGTRDREEAEKLLAEFVQQLDREKPLELLNWFDFRARFESQRMPMMSQGTRETYGITFKFFEHAIGPIALRDINARTIADFQAFLRNRGNREITILKHVRQLRAALQWAYELELIDRLPAIPKAPRGSIPRKMKGRPLTEEEFARYLAAIDQVVPKGTVDAWRFFVRGLWFQGLRVGEATTLSWDRDDRHRVDLESFEYPVIWIQGHLEKGKKDRIHPIAPEFAAMLREIPRENRTGDVFFLPSISRSAVSHIGSDIGKKADIAVSVDPKTARKKFASFHDLRRSCALRWAAKLMPQELMEFMRHSSMQVTMDYYAGQRPLQTAKTMWNSLHKPEQNK